MKTLAPLLLGLVLSGALRAGGFDLQLDPARAAQGSTFRVYVSGAPDQGRPTATFRGRRLLFFPGSTVGDWKALAAVDLEDPAGPIPVEVKMGEQTQTASLQVVAGSYPVDRLRFRVSKDLDPGREKAIEERIERDQAKAKAVGLILTDQAFAGKLKVPCKGRISSSFGHRRVINDVPRQPHGGTDIAAPTGRLVRAAAPGVVRLVDDMFFSGNTVFVDHGAGWMTTYFHLSSIWVKEGDKVDTTSVIGRVGRTGRATGPHLHWGLQWQRAKVNPLLLVGEPPVVLARR